MIVYTQLSSQNKPEIIIRMDMHPHNYSYLYVHVVSLNNPQSNPKQTLVRPSTSPKKTFNQP